jgi:hypothetical protein
MKEDTLINASSQSPVPLKSKVLTGDTSVVVIWIMTLYRFSSVYHCSGETRYFHLQEDNPERNNPLIPLFNLKMLRVWAYGSLSLCPHPPVPHCLTTSLTVKTFHSSLICPASSQQHGRILHYKIHTNNICTDKQ